MKLRWCRDCLDYHFSNERCHPEFLVWCPERGEAEEDAYEIRGRDIESALENWASRDDSESAEYSIVSQREEPIVHVRDGAAVRRFRVTGEAQPVYHAAEIE